MRLGGSTALRDIGVQGKGGGKAVTAGMDGEEGETNSLDMFGFEIISCYFFFFIHERN